MLLNKWLEGQLREFLGHYVEIDAEALKLGVWKGDLVLENVRLLPGPISGTQLCVAEGRLSRLEVKVPWKQLKRKPVVMRVEGLHIIYGPQRSMSAEERQQEADLALQRKRTLVAVLDEGGDEYTMAAGDDGESSASAHLDSASATIGEDQTHKNFRERLLDTVRCWLIDFLPWQLLQ